jgi:hypothetical protein
MSKTEKDINVEAIIKKAVKAAMKAGLEAGLVAGRAEVQKVDDAYKATERRLYAVPKLIKRVEDKRLQLVELQRIGSPERSKDIARFSVSGARLSDDEKLDALLQDITAQIARDEYEIETIKKAVERIEDDPYYLVVKGRYFEGISDEKIAEQIPCDERTVRRQRSRLVRTVAIWLYGAEAV